MQSIIIGDNDYLTMQYYPDEKIFHHTIHRELTDAEFREILEAGLEVFKKYGAGKWLADNRKMGIISAENTKWIDEDWTPRSKAAGWKYWAMVVPDDMMARMNITYYVDFYYERGIRIMVFSELEEAHGWLLGIDK